MNNVAKKKEWTMSTLYTIGQIGQAADALDNAGCTPDELTKIIQNKIALRNFLEVIRGHAEIMVVEHLIDCDAQPFIPDGWKVEEHHQCGQWKFDLQKISLYLSKKQNKGAICGNDLRKELANKTVHNANVLDYLLAYPNLIPEEWKGKIVFFWGTIYRSAGDGLCVRDLIWGGSQWDWGYFWLDDVFDSGCPAALVS